MTWDSNPRFWNLHILTSHRDEKLRTRLGVLKEPEAQGAAVTAGCVAAGAPLLVVPTLHGEDSVDGKLQKQEEKEKERERAFPDHGWHCKRPLLEEKEEEEKEEEEASEDFLFRLWTSLCSSATSLPTVSVQVLFLEVVVTPVVVQRLVGWSRQCRLEAPQSQFFVQIVVFFVVAQRQIPMSSRFPSCRTFGGRCPCCADAARFTGR